MMQFFTNLDTSLFFLLNNVAGQSKTVDFFIIFFAEYLAFVLPFIFLILLYKTSSSFREKIFTLGVVFSSSLFAYILTSIIRFLYARPRPFLTYNVHQLISESSHSFPSLHVTFFFAFSFSIYFYNKKWGIWFLLASVLMGISRVMAGVHYPTDIITGAILGFIISWLIYKLGRPASKLTNSYL